MKTHKLLRRLMTMVLFIALALSPFIALPVFSQAGPGENSGPLRSPSSLYRSQMHPLQIGRNALSTPSNKAATAADEWQLYPFYGGEMLSLAMSPANNDIVYVGTRDAGVFKTTNGGVSWQPKRNGLTFWPVNVLTIDPTNENVLYAGTEYAGVWKSSDGGDSWFQVHNGVLNNGKSWVVRDIAMDYQNTQIIYVGYYEPYYGGHILKTANGGASWDYKDSGLPKDGDGDADMIYSLAIDPGNHLTLYAGTWGDGAFRTVNGGESWEAINCGMPDDLGYKYAYVYSFAFDPHHANRLCSILDHEYYIFNAGSCWEKVSTDGRVDQHIKFHPTDAAIMYSYGGFFHISSDGGVTWGYAEENIDRVNDIVFHTDFPGTIYAATEWYGDEGDGYRSGGVYKTTDGATTWNEATQGITARVIASVGIAPQNSDLIYAIVTQSSDQVLIKSQDGGQTWQTGYHFRFPTIDFVAADPQTPGQLYAGGWGGDFYFSDDDGQTFYTINEISHPTGVTFDPQNPDTLYVGTIADGIYKSTDAGTLWTQKNNGLPADPDDGSIWVDAIAVDPNNSSVVWAGLNVREGIYKSENGGESWVLKGLNDDFDAHKILSIAINPDNSDVIFAGTGTSGPGSIYRTTDGGATWGKMLTDIAWVYKIVYDPRNSNWLYAATEGYGVLRSRDGGEAWHDYNNGLFYPVLYSLAITQGDPPLLVTGSYGSGLYWRRPSQNLPPNTPSTPVPADGAGDVPTHQVLGWQGGDPDGDPVTYTLAISAGGQSPVVDTTTLTHYTPSLAGETAYSWVVTATDGISTVVGPTWSFTTAVATAPLTPTITKSVTPEGQVDYGDEITYTLTISAENGTQVRLYDRLVGTTWLRSVGQLPMGITHDDGILTGTLMVTPANQVTVDFVTQLDIPGTAGITATIANRACVYPVGGTLDNCIWSNEVANFAFLPYRIYLPVTLRNY
ncbi:MAG: hypothetical protein JXA21_01185 [Anaerolineae bacterium]|nr:hypothetical protein [Anaerolineae bacterium]